MAFVATTATQKIMKMKKRLRFICGGTSASKTISTLLVLIDLAQIDTEPTLTSVVSESMPHLKRGAMKDFLDIMKSHSYYKERDWNRTDKIYTFETGSKIEFFSVDQASKVRGPRRERLFMNEVNHIAFEIFNQLEVRTKDFVIADWNPSNEFWFYTDIKDKRKDVDFLTLTYLDNEALDKSIVQTIEQRKGNAAWWKVYGLGQLGEVEGKIYTNWKIIDSVPEEARLERYGLDFGFSVDPTVIEALYKWNNGYVIDEVLYQKGLSNKSIADVLNGLAQALVIADSAEPKSIDEIKSYGVSIIGAVKGPGSVRQGIAYVQDQVIYITKRSLKTIQAYRNYMWAMDKDGKIISPNVPDDTIHEWSNPMDSIRYGFNGFFKAQVKKPQLTKTILQSYR